MNNIIQKFFKGEMIAASICLMASMLIIFTAAITRALGYPLNWSVDMSLFLFAWSTFLGADIAFRNNGLVNMDLFVEMLPTKAKKGIYLLGYLVVLCFLISTIIFGVWLCYTTRNRAFQGIPNFSYTWVTLSIPVSFFLMTLTCIKKMRSYLSKESNA